MLFNISYGLINYCLPRPVYLIASGILFTIYGPQIFDLSTYGFHSIQKSRHTLDTSDAQCSRLIAILGKRQDYLLIENCGGSEVELSWRLEINLRTIMLV